MPEVQYETAFRIPRHVLVNFVGNLPYPAGSPVVAHRGQRHGLSRNNTTLVDMLACHQVNFSVSPGHGTTHAGESAEDGAPLSDADKANMFQAALQSLQIQLGEKRRLAQTLIAELSRSIA